MGDVPAKSFLISSSSCWRASISSSVSSIAGISDSLYFWLGMGPGMIGLSFSAPDFGPHLGLSPLMNAPTARFTACANQLIKYSDLLSFVFYMMPLTVSTGTLHQTQLDLFPSTASPALDMLCHWLNDYQL